MFERIYITNILTNIYNKYIQQIHRYSNALICSPLDCTIATTTVWIDHSYYSITT